MRRWVCVVLLLSACGAQTHQTAILKPVGHYSHMKRMTMPRTTRSEARKPLRVNTALNWQAVARCESNNEPGVVDSSGTYYGLYQFDIQTWRAMGGQGLPSKASITEQTYRAQKLYELRGSAPWPVCGRYLSNK